MWRGWVLWIGSAWLGSLIGMIGLAVLSPFSSPWPWIVVAAAGPLLFTLGGSALLVLVFAYLRPRRIAVRYAVLLVIGPAAGAAMLGFFGTPTGLGLGAGFGFVTTVAWVTLHKLLYGST